MPQAIANRTSIFMTGHHTLRAVGAVDGGLSPFFHRQFGTLCGIRNYWAVIDRPYSAELGHFGLYAQSATYHWRGRE
jgi:hypothetical protein